MKKVLHIFNHYLLKTEVWSYNLIRNTPKVEHHIAAKVYKENVPGAGVFHFMQHGLSALEESDQNIDGKRNIFKKLWIRIQKKKHPSFFEQASEYITNKQIDLIHAHFANIGWECIALAKQSNIPLVVSFYGWDYEMLPTTQPIWKERYLELFLTAKKILVEGEHGRKTLISMGCADDKVEIQRLGIPSEMIHEIRKTKKSNELSLIQIASYTEKKGQLYTVRAFAQALKHCPNLKLTLIGDARDGVYKKKVLDEIEGLKIKDQVTLRDFIEYGDIAEELSKHQVFIHPSCYGENRNCEGGAPTILFNAMANGLPVIASKHCDIPSVVPDEVAGLLASEKDPDGLAAYIQQFYEMDNESYQGFSSASHKQIEENYQIERNGLELEQVYQSLMKQVGV